DAATGVVTFKAAPDFEAPVDADGDNVYDIVVTASDGTLTTDRAVAITVTNQNENGSPSITSSGGADTAQISVPENTTAVTTITANDPDAGDTLTYSIVGGADAAQFSVNASTGALSFVAAPDFEAPSDAGADNVYDVTVQVSDGHGGIDAVAIQIGVRQEFLNLPTSGDDLLIGTSGADSLD
ncbi:cadherin domain-containing protein, partial [Ensifer sp. 22564]